MVHNTINNAFLNT